MDIKSYHWPWLGPLYPELLYVPGLVPLWYWVLPVPPVVPDVPVPGLYVEDDGVYPVALPPLPVNPELCPYVAPP